jgi:hypothetical protein
VRCGLKPHRTGSEEGVRLTDHLNTLDVSGLLEAHLELILESDGELGPGRLTGVQAKYTLGSKVLRD